MPIPLGILAVAGAGGGAAASAFDLLETTTLGTATASVTFSSLNTYSDYKHLQIRMTVRNASTSSSIRNILVRFNSDSGNNYGTHRLFGDATSVASAGLTGNDSALASNVIPDNNLTTGAFGAGVIDILDFSNTSKNTTIRTLGGVDTASISRITLSSSVWLNTAAVTSITLSSSLNNLLSASRFSLYGIK
jgi:hypothetical protein